MQYTRPGDAPMRCTFHGFRDGLILIRIPDPYDEGQLQLGVELSTLTNDDGTPVKTVKTLHEDDLTEAEISKLISLTSGAAFIERPGEFEMHKLDDVQRKIMEVRARRACIEQDALYQKADASWADIWLMNDRQMKSPKEWFMTGVEFAATTKV